MSDQFGVKDVVGAPVERTRLAEQSLVAIPPRSTRFTMHEWNLSNSLRCRNTEDQQQLADRILGECDRVRNETAERSSTLQLTSERRMAERAADVRFEADELRERRTELCLELGRLETYTSRCQTCLAALAENALNACRKCLMLRDGRIGIDLVVDNVEDALQREITTILGAQSLVRRALEQTNEQMRRIRAARYSIDRNLHYKTIAVDTDEATMRMKHSDLGLCVYEGYSNLDPATISLEEWNLQSAKDIQQAAKEVTSARPIRVYIDTLLKQVVEDLWDSFDKCNKAFQDRITETKRAKAHLEDMHAETVIKVNDMQNNLVLLQKALADKEGYAALAHTRLGRRASRPGAELVRDAPGQALYVEAEMARRSVEQLQQMTQEATSSLRYLLQVQVQLEEDINVKMNTLKIDEVDCMTIRESMDYHEY